MAHIAIAYDTHACSPWILGHNKINLAWSMRRSLDKIKKPSISLGTYYGNYLRCDRSVAQSNVFKGSSLLCPFYWLESHQMQSHPLAAGTKPYPAPH